MGEDDTAVYEVPTEDYSQLDPSQYDIPAQEDYSGDTGVIDYSQLDPSQYDIPAQDPSQDPGQYDPTTDWTDPNYAGFMYDVASDPNSGYYDPSSPYYDPTLDPSHPAYDATLDPYSSDFVPLTEFGSGLQARSDINYAPDQLMPQDVSLPYEVWRDPTQYSGLGNVAGQFAGEETFPWMTSTKGSSGGGGGINLSGGGISLGGKGAAGTASNPLSTIGTDMSKLLSQILGYNLTRSLTPNPNSAATLPKVSISPASGNPNGAASLFGYGSSGTGTTAKTVTPSSLLSGASNFLNSLTTGQKLAGAAAIVAAVYLMRRPKSSGNPARVVYRQRRKAA